MANKFKDAEKRKKVAPGGNSVVVANIADNVVDDVVDNAIDDVTENILESITETTPNASFADALSGKIEKKPEGKSVSLYLTTEALENLEKFAKANRCSKSKAADLILRNLY